MRRARGAARLAPRRGAGRPRRDRAAAGRGLRRRAARLPAARRAAPCRSTCGSAARARATCARRRRASSTTPLAEAAARRSTSPSHDVDDVALVVHTSGTTGAPEPVELTYGNSLCERARLGASRSGSTRDERWLCPLPLSPRRRADDPAALARSTATHRVVLEPLRRRARRARCATATSRSSRSSRRRSRGCSTPAAAPARAAPVLLGGAPGRARAAARAPRDAGVPVAQTYGLTEACSQVTIAEPGDARDRRPRRCPARACAIAADGEILVAGPTVGAAAATRCAPATSARLDDAGPPDRDRPQGGHDRHRRRERRARRGRGGAARSTRPSPRPRSSAARTRSGARRSTARVVPARRRRRRPPTSCARHCAERLAALQGPQGVRARRRALPRTRPASCCAGS